MRTNSIGFFAEESSLHNTKKKGSSHEEGIILRVRLGYADALFCA